MRYPPIDLPVSLPCVMGIVNVTPDSFSDGGEHADTDSAVAHGLLLAAEGAAILDVGGESTRPGSDPVAADDELARVVPVIERLAVASPALISIDTTKAVVARAAFDAGAVLVNDVTALRGDPAMAALVAERGCPLCLMHMLGEPRTMQDDPRYDDVVAEVVAFLEERLAFAVAAGVREEQVLLDPGIGFGKTVRHNLLLLAHLDRVAALGRPSCWARRASASSAPCWAPSPASAPSAPSPRPCWVSPAARPSCACTTCAPTSRRCAWRRPSSTPTHPTAVRRRAAPPAAPAEPPVSPARAPWRSRSPPSRRPVTAA